MNIISVYYSVLFVCHIVRFSELVYVIIVVTFLIIIDRKQVRACVSDLHIYCVCVYFVLLFYSVVVSLITNYYNLSEPTGRVRD